MRSNRPQVAIVYPLRRHMSEGQSLVPGQESYVVMFALKNGQRAGDSCLVYHRPYRLRPFLRNVNSLFR